MAYVLNGTHDESFGFHEAIANFALRAVHESQGLIGSTTVVTPQQGNTFLIPLFSPITYQDYSPEATTGNVQGNADEQNPNLGQSSIVATPTVAATAYDVFYAGTTSFQFAAALGAELGESFAEKTDQRIAKAFLDFKTTPTNTLYSPTPVDGFARPTHLGAMELRRPGATGGTPTANFTAGSVLELIRLVKQNWRNSRLPGNPVVVLDAEQSMNRLLGELTGAAVGSAETGGSNLSELGNELLRSGMISNIYGVSVIFSTFLSNASRAVAGGAPEVVKVGAYYGANSLYTVVKQGLEIRTGMKPGGLQEWLTGLGYMGAGVGDLRRGGSITIEMA
jgi:hypothetical protein